MSFLKLNVCDCCMPTTDSTKNILSKIHSDLTASLFCEADVDSDGIFDKVINVDIAIIDRSSHPAHYTIPPLYQPPLTKPTLNLCGSYDIASYSHKDWVYYPYYFAESALVVDGFYNNKLPQFSKLEKDYKFSCLIRSPHHDRVWFYTHLHQRNFYKDCMASFYNNHAWGDKLSLDALKNDVDSTTYDYFIKYIYHTLPHCIDADRETYDIPTPLVSRDIYHPAFSNTYVNIISEHLYDKCFLSEKTVKPLAAEQLFLMAGPKCAIRHIEDLGFDVFGDYIDHDYYDNESDWKIRLTKMLDVASELSTQDLLKIHKATEPRRMRNRQHLFSDELTNMILSPLKDWINNASK